MADENDRRFMAAAIRLGGGALGTTWPNPAVGAILVRDGRVISRGRTARGGRPHAEAIALKRAGDLAAGGTLYVSLEPCSHQGQTPPCADAILNAGVRRVVAPLADPDPRVAGKGFERLRTGGVEISAGLLAPEAQRAHVGHIARNAGPMPHVTLKLAVSADDAIGRIGEGNVPVTGAIARRHAQALRSRFDAVLVGSGTVAADDPLLTCRLPGLKRRSPVRVVLDSEAKLDGHFRVFSESSAPAWLMSAAKGFPPNNRIRKFVLPRSTLGGLDLWSCMYRLSDEGITRVLVEGGARIARAFLEADLVEDVLLFRSSVVLGGNVVPALAGLDLAEIENSDRFRRTERRMFGADRMSRYERAR
ncbi:MAG: bifunctional diaminohydroxyphosphoribosylaminopyrimidine deaminase/5-amino-6-(5-phosphoribosylamino)uracil reductase RibD [Rhizobiales bacterium]|nr:bifunctional diaminohydroxyphosphoribosylaminopyrimidine deaminase/5-amino-6-(5-phosphoribosylamino)uracil reductase RibD [Hyphomicrobiales bacterium]